MKNLLHRIDNNLVFILAAVIALMVRIYGNGYGLPDQLNIDEIHVVARAVKFGSGDFNPHFFSYPAFHMYFMFVMYGAFFAIGSIAGAFHGAADFGMQYFTDPTMFFLIARTVSALMGTATVVLAAAFASRYYGRIAGAAAALLMALNYLHAEHSHYTTTDVPMTFWFMLCLYLAPGPGMKVTRRSFVLAGIFGGIAMATKYTAALLLPILFVMYLLYYFQDRRPGDKPPCGISDFVILGVVFFAAFFICAPYTLLDFQAFKMDVLIQKELMDKGWLGFENIQSMWWHIIAVLLRQGLGLPLLLVSVAAIAHALHKRRGPDLALVLFLVVFYIINGKSGQVFSRYFVPAVPVLCILAGRFLSDAAALLRNRHLEATCIVALLVSYIPAKSQLEFQATLRNKDTRTLAREWIEQAVPPGTRIATEMTGPQLHPTPESVTDAGRPARYEKYRVDNADPFFVWKNREPAPDQTNTEKSFHVRALEKIEKKYYVFQPFSLAQYSLDLYREEGYDYIIASGETYNRYFEARDKYPEAAAFYESLNREAYPIMYFPQELELRHGPEIKIYRLIKKD